MTQEQSYQKENNNFDLHLTERKELDRILKQEWKEKDSQDYRWEFITGSYRDWNQELKTPEDLQGIEISIYKNIQEKLKKRKDEGRTDPIIALDFGAGMAATWCRLAAHFQEEIEKEDLQLIATSWGFHLEKEQKASDMYNAG